MKALKPKDVWVGNGREMSRVAEHFTYAYFKKQSLFCFTEEELKEFKKTIIREYEGNKRTS